MTATPILNLPEFLSVSRLHGTQFWFAMNRFGHVDSQRYFGGRHFTTKAQLLACFYVAGFQHVVEFDGLPPVRKFVKFRDHILDEKGFGWKPWTQFSMMLKGRTTFFFAFSDLDDAMHFRIIW